MKKNLLFIVLFLFTFCKAQNDNESHWKKEISNISLNSAGEKEIKTIQNIIKNCQQSGYTQCEGSGYLKIAYIFFKGNNTIEAIHYIDKIEKNQLITSDSDLEAFFHLKTLQCSIYQSTGEYTAALEKLKEFPEKINDYPYFNYWINVLNGNIYGHMQNNKLAKEYYKRAYQLSKICREESNLNKLSIKKESQIGNSYKATPYLATAYLNLGKTDSAKLYIQEALGDLKNLNNIKDLDIKYLTHFNAGTIYSAEKNYAKAQEHYLISKKIIEKYYPIENLQKDIYSVLLHLYEKTNETDSINYYSKKIFEIDEKNKAKNISIKKIIDNKNNTVKKELAGNNQKLIYILVAITLLCSLLIFLSLFLYKKYKSRKFDKKDFPVNPAIAQTNYHELFEEIVLLAKQNKPEFMTRFNELYPGFSNKLLAVNSDIQSSEIRFSAYLYLNFSTKEIAEYTHISVRTVQTKKYNLRKKLSIPTDMDIYVWFNHLMQ